MKITKSIFCLLAVPMILSGVSTYAEENKTIEDAFKNGRTYLDMKYRYEFVDQENLDNANASTLRTRIGYETGEFKGVNGLVEVENIFELGSRRYNDTVNPNKDDTNYATVADPKGTQLNQAYLNWKAPVKTNIRAGRQAVNLDNQRFIGSVDWRQNNQTFDAAVISNNYFEDINVTYAFVERVNRIFGDDSTAGVFDSNDVHLFNASYSGLDLGKITVYDYLLDVPDSPANSSKTAGIRFAGKSGESFKVLYALEYAHQNDYGTNTTSYNANYTLAELGGSYKGLTVKAGREELGSDNNASFQTPLATGHKFNGWADKFLATPINGLKDSYGTLKYKVSSDNYLNNIVTAFTFHNFESSKNSLHYGREYDFLVKKQINKHYNVGLKVAVYKADQFAVDTTKAMLFTGIKF